MTQWLERGVFEALTKKYLKTLIFSIFIKHPTSAVDILLESYEFKCDYMEENFNLTPTTKTSANNNNNNNNNISSSSSSHQSLSSKLNSAKLNNVALTSKEDLKTQACRFVRSLVDFANTLDDIPQDRYITFTMTVTKIEKRIINNKIKYFCS